MGVKTPDDLRFEGMEDVDGCDDGPDAIFRLNIGGRPYCFRREMVLMDREPSSLLAILIRADHQKRLVLVDEYLEATGEYYLERNSRVAGHIMDYYLTGALHKPQDICIERFREELLFWRLTNVQLAPCCTLLVDTSGIKNTIEREKELDEITFLPECRKVIWHLMEEPSSSVFSKLFSLVSITFIFTSIAGLILGSMPEFQEDNHLADFYHLNLYGGGGKQWQSRLTEAELESKRARLLAYHQQRLSNMSGGSTAPEALEFVYRPTDDPQHWLVRLEHVCIGWFTAEYVVRFLVAPRKMKFLRRTMNLIDLFTFLPFFFELSLSSLFGINAETLKELTGAMLVIRVLRVLRMARVFKLARYSTGLQVFGNTLRSSLRELCMLSVFLLTGTMFFSTIIYYLEKDQPGTDFTSIPAAGWFVLITVTTVGYGDCQILTAAGKTVAAVASIFGIIILAFPISMVVENFAFAQQQTQVENEIKEAQMAVVANDYILKHYPSQRRVRQIKKSREEAVDPLLMMSGVEPILSSVNSHEGSLKSRRRKSHLPPPTNPATVTWTVQARRGSS